MTRLERKCFVGSAAFHGLLLMVFLLSSAFLGSKPKPMRAIEVVDLSGKVTDRLISTGGSPRGSATPAPPAQANPLPPPPAPPVEPPKVVPPKPQPEVKKEVAKPKPVETKKEIVKDKGEMPVKKDTKKTPDKPKEVVENKPTRTISTNVIKRSNADLIAAQREAQKRLADDKAAREYAKAYGEYQRQMQALNSRIDGVIGGVGKSLGDKTVAVPLGDGGAAYVHYGSLVAEKYKQAVYASRPQGDEDAIAVIRIVVIRNGMVKDSDWVRKTGNSVLDKAVDRAMKDVRVLPRFPDGATDNERTFTINIGFEAKRVST